MAEAAVDWAISKLGLLLTEEVKLLKDVHSELESVKDELESIRSFLRDADSRLYQENVDNSVKTWVKQVREVAFRIEDVIDEYMYYVAWHQDKHGCLVKTVRFVKNLKSRHEIAAKIQAIKKWITEIRERREKYSFNFSSEQGSSDSHNTWHDPRVDSLFTEETELVGIESLKTDLRSKLVEGISKRTVISIVGMGGLGKTTLANKVYDSVKVHFDCHAWITVSQSYKIKELLWTMIKEFQQGWTQPAFEGIDKMDEVLLIRKLREYLSGKRYVVVFDDVWRTDFWGCIKNALPDNEKGSRIIITTRNEGVAPTSDESSFCYICKLQPLPPDKAFELFCNKVFQSKESYCPPELLEWSLAIVERCEGLPLAIVTIGGLLATKQKTVAEWKKFLDGLSSSLASDQHLSNITKILSLSYHALPFYLKSCFLYFSLFPEDYSISCQRLIRLWIAEGFIKEKQDVALEEVAEDYLTELICRSLVQVALVSFEGKAKKCRVHDLMREFILSRARELSFNQVSIENYKSLKGRGRHLAIYGKLKNSPESSSNAHTHSIILFDGDEIPKSLISSFIGKFKLLRSLDLGKAPLKYIPEELGNLWHLRYLSLRKTSVKTLPKSIGKLRNLETLDLRLSLVYDLPVEINRLCNLRHFLAYLIDFDDEFNPNYQRGVKIHGGIGSLKTLQKLKYIEVDHDISLLHQLESLTQLKKLGIRKLKRENGSTLCNALEKMTCLNRLSISSVNEEEFLDLQSMSNPPPLLQHLYLNGPLVELPRWFPKLTSLVKIHLNWSRLGDNAMQVIQALPNLLKLNIYEGYNGEQLHFRKGWFPKLKVLSLKCLTGMNMLIIEEGALPLLEELSIGSCPQLKEVPSGIHFLRYLKQLIFFNMHIEISQGMLKDGGQAYRNIPLVLFSYQTEIEYNVYRLGDYGFIKL